MSKKCQAIAAREEFRDDNPIPIRSLFFEDYKENRFTVQQVYFPENRMSLVYDGVLYDWYGREIKLGDNIKKVVRPFGYSFGNSACETFVVQREDDKLAIAALVKNAQSYYANEYTLEDLVKDSVLGRILLDGQKLSLRYKWSFNREVDPQKYACLQNFKANYKILTGIQYDSMPEERSEIRFYPTIEEPHFNSISHWIFKNREDILSAQTKMLSKDRYIPMINGATNTFFLYGPFMYSDPSGDKISAFTRVPGISEVAFVRISTDTEVLQHAENKKSLIWYYDPE